MPLYSFVLQDICKAGRNISVVIWADMPSNWNIRKLLIVLPCWRGILHHSYHGFAICQQNDMYSIPTRFQGWYLPAEQQLVNKWIGFKYPEDGSWTSPANANFCSMPNLSVHLCIRFKLEWGFSSFQREQIVDFSRGDHIHEIINCFHGYETTLKLSDVQSTDVWANHFVVIVIVRFPLYG